ncbi:hypothetical protein CsSME_00026246 [Camellia sinensis var. sinensis]
MSVSHVPCVHVSETSSLVQEGFPNVDSDTKLWWWVMGGGCGCGNYGLWWLAMNSVGRHENGNGHSISPHFHVTNMTLSVVINMMRSPSFMSELDIQIPSTFDPFAEANAEDSSAGSKEYVHIRIQQRNGRKSLTTVQGLKKEFSYNKILKDLKKEFCCNGTVVQDPELGQVIQLQGDQRKNVSTFLVQAGIVKKEHIKIHGF